MDIIPALQGDLPAVASSLAWVTRLLWFAARDEANTTTEHMQAIKSTLASLRCRPQLQPSHGSFTAAAFIVRALLDELMPRLGMDTTVVTGPSKETVSEASIGERSSKAYKDGTDGSIELPDNDRPDPKQHAVNNRVDSEGVIVVATASSKALLERAGSDEDGQAGSWLLDQRVLQLCCPQLDAARQALQVSADAKTGS